MFKTKEQRSFPRIAVDCQINYKMINEASFRQGTAKNISSKGVLFITNDEIEVGTMMEIKIVPGATSVPAHGAIIEVIRVNAVKSDNKFEIAGLIKALK